MLSNGKWFLNIFLQFVSFFGFLFVSLFSYSYESARFTNITAENGLISNYVRSVTQDSNGFLWFGTDAGLTRFDGYQFTNYQHIPNDPTSLSDDNITAIIADTKSNVWVGTVSDGLNRLDISTGKITRYTHNKHNTNTIRSNLILFLHLENDNELWISTNKGVDILDITTDKISHFNLTSDTTKLKYVNKILSIDNNLWFSTNLGIFIYNKINNEIKNIIYKPNEKNSLSSNIIIDLFQDNKERILVATLEGFDYINPASLEISHSKLFPNISQRNHITSIVGDRKNNIWVIKKNEGVFRINSSLTAYKQYYIDSFFGHTLSNLFIDNNQVLWVILQSGLYRLSLRTELFGFQSHFPNKKNQENKPVRGLYEDTSDFLWIGQKQLLRFNPITRKYDQPFKSINNYDKGIFSNLEASTGDNKKNIWFSTNERDIAHYNTENNSLQHYSITNLLNDNLLPNEKNQIRGLFYDKTLNLLWLNTNNTLYQFYEDEHKLIPITFLPDSMEHIHHGYINEIYTDLKGYTWIGTYFGLFKLEKGKVISYFKNNLGTNSSISHNTIFSIIGNHKDLWIGTQNGLNKYNYSNKSFSLITTQDGLPDNHIRSILLDKNHDLWVSTNRGLSRINANNGSITNFNKNDGLQSDIFNISSMLARKNGQLVFGGDKGFNLFNPDDIEKAKVKDIQISELHLFNKKVYLADLQTKNKEHEITDPNTIVLDHKQNDLSISLSAVDYHDPMSIHYRYKLEGFNETWINRDAKNRTASFTNLDHGTYTLKAHATYDPNNYWPPEKTLLTIIVLPPWWQTIYAYIAYVLLAIALIYALIRLQTYRLKRKAMELENTVNQRTEEIQQQKNVIERLLDKKNEMFAYISHEFRTPLTLISGPISDIKQILHDKKGLQLLSIAERNTERMTSLVNQLLDLSQAYQLEKQPKISQSISDIANQLSASFQAIADNKQITFTVSITPELWANAIERTIESILTNLLANAFKYTNERGEIALTIQKTHQSIIISVKDTGIGIPEDKTQTIFEQFTRLEDINRNKIEGTGLGLALVKQLVDIHNWEISVISKVDVGSEFIVTLPFDENLLDLTDTNASTLSTEVINQITYLDHILSDEPRSKETNNTMELSETDGHSKLLIIDDTEDMVLYLQGLLSSDYHCSMAYNGEAGLDLATKESPDLILCDVMMPGISGFEVLDQLRSQLETSHIPVLLLTAKGDKESRLKGLSKLADDYIAKPFDGDELKARIKAILSLRKLRQEQVLNKLLNNDVHQETEPPIELTPRDKIFIDKWQATIEKHHNNPEITVNELSGYMAMSSRRLLTKVKSLSGKGPKEFLDEYRIAKAKELLKTKALAISEISERVGFDSSAYFSKRFKEVMQVSPREYRKRW